MSEDYAEYGHDNIQLEPIRIRQTFHVTGIEKLGKDAEVTLLAEGIPGGYITISLPDMAAAAFHLGQAFSVMLTESVGLGVKDA